MRLLLSKLAHVPCAFSSAIVAVLVRGYQLAVSPLLGQRCKYYPSCSQYAVDAVREVGALRGSVLAGWRLLRCNPWSHGGVDKVSERRLFRRTAP